MILIFLPVWEPRYLRVYKLEICHHSTAAIRVIVTNIGWDVNPKSIGLQVSVLNRPDGLAATGGQPGWARPAVPCIGLCSLGSPLVARYLGASCFKT